MKPQILLVSIFFASFAYAQKAALSYYDFDWQPAKAKEAFYLVEQKKINDTCWEWNYYKARGPRIKSVHYKDGSGSIQHGQYIVYQSNGLADSIGYYINGKKENTWRVIASNMQVLFSIEYENDVIVRVRDSMKLKEDRERRADSIRKNYKGTDTVEIESEFAGGLDGWRQYLEKNFKYPKESINRHAEGMAAIIFTINAAGKVEDPAVYRSVEYHIDKEAMRLIIISPVWKPAVQYGRNVRSYKIQPVLFKLI